MAKQPSAALRAQLRKKILARVAALELVQTAAAEQLGITASQMSRLSAGEDIFSLERLVDAAVQARLTTRTGATVSATKGRRPGSLALQWRYPGLDARARNLRS